MRTTKVILNEDVYNLGEEGDVCEVAPGYARNYLVPRGLAVSYSRQNIAQFEERRTAIEKRKEEKRDLAKTVRERIESLEIVMEMPAGPNGKLFGSVTNQAVVERLAQEGIQVERKKVEVPGHTIKMTGAYEVLVKLYAEEAATVTLKVVSEGGEPKKPEEQPERKQEAQTVSEQPETAAEVGFGDAEEYEPRSGEPGDEEELEDPAE